MMLLAVRLLLPLARQAIATASKCDFSEIALTLNLSALFSAVEKTNSPRSVAPLNDVSVCGVQFTKQSPTSTFTMSA
jgi:hypothetical protein